MHANQALARFLTQLARAADELAAELTRPEEAPESEHGHDERRGERNAEHRRATDEGAQREAR